MGCAKSKPSSDDELQKRNGPVARAPPPQPTPPPPPPPPPKNVNQNQPNEVPPSTTALSHGSEQNENKEKSISESTVSSSERIIEAPVIPPPITPKREEPQPANINAGRDDDSPSVGAILVLGALSGIAVESAVSYLSSDGSKQVKAPPPKKTCDNPNGCGPCTLTKVKDLRYSFASRRYLWVESHDDHVSVHATPGKDSTVDARAHFNAEGGFNPTSNNNNKLAKDNDRNADEGINHTINKNDTLAKDNHDKAQEGANPTSNSNKLFKANDDNSEVVNSTSNNDSELAKENNEDAEEAVNSKNDQSHQSNVTG